jgi:hypothetical protein
MNYRNHITIEPKKRGDKPCVRGLKADIAYATDRERRFMTALLPA